MNMNINRNQQRRFSLNDHMDRSRSNTPDNLVNLCGNFLESSSDETDEGKLTKPKVVDSNIILRRSESGTPENLIPLCGDFLSSSSEKGGSTPPRPAKYAGPGWSDDEKQFYTDDEG